VRLSPLSSFQVRPAVILASSRCLAVSAVLESAPFGPDPLISSRLEEQYKSLSPFSPDPSWGWELKSLWYATLYGGLVLMYTCGPVTPISRVHVDEGLDIGVSDRARRQLDELDLLRAWAMIWVGQEREGLQELAGPTLRPEGYSWGPGGPHRVAFRGIVY